MTRLWIALLTGIAIMAMASAQLDISPSTVDVNVKVNEEKTFNLTLTNNFDFEITEFKFTNLSGFTFPNITIAPHTSQTVTVKVKRDQSATEALRSDVSFSYLVDIPAEVKTHKINITDLGFEPNFLVIHDGDSVVWTNKDDITRTAASGSFTYTLSPNQSSTPRIFSQVGTVAYQDLILFAGATLEVINRSLPQKVHNPIYNRILAVNLEVTADPTNLIVSSQISNYQIDAQGAKEGSLTVQNTGANRAERITLSSNSAWLRFSKNDFNVNANDHTFVNFEIAPFILNTNATNKTYHINISVKGANTPSYSIPISVFIPFQDVSEELNTDDDFLVAYERYCTRNPQRLLCNNTVSDSGKGEKIIVRDPQIQFNGSLFTLAEIANRIQRIEDGAARTNNNVNGVAEEFRTTAPELARTSNETLTRQIAFERKYNTNHRIVWIVGFFLAFIYIISQAFGSYNRHRLNRNMYGVVYK